MIKTLCLFIGVFIAPLYAQSIYDSQITLKSDDAFSELENAEEKAKRKFIFELVNDFLTLANTDRHLTNSLQIGQLSDKLPKFLEWYAKESDETYYIATLTQEIYTPEDFSRTDVIEDDRPYAGWTYVTFGLSREEDSTLKLTAIDVGIVGDASQADYVQTEFHELIGSKIPQGWDNQLENELGVNIRHYRARNFRVEHETFTSDISAFYGGSIGNVQTSLTAGFMARVGHNVPSNILTGHELKDNLLSVDDFSFYGFAGYSGQFVARDIFLDGNTFQDSHSVEKKRFVNRFSMGIAASLGDFKLSYSYNITSKQFKKQDGLDRIGLLTFEYSKNF